MNPNLHFYHPFDGYHWLQHMHTHRHTHTHAHTCTCRSASLRRASLHHGDFVFFKSLVFEVSACSWDLLSNCWHYDWEQERQRDKRERWRDWKGERERLRERGLMSVCLHVYVCVCVRMCFCLSALECVCVLCLLKCPVLSILMFAEKKRVYKRWW